MNLGSQRKGFWERLGEGEKHGQNYYIKTKQTSSSSSNKPLQSLVKPEQKQPPGGAKPQPLASCHPAGSGALVEGLQLGRYKTKSWLPQSPSVHWCLRKDQQHSKMSNCPPCEMELSCCTGRLSFISTPLSRVSFPSISLFAARKVF